MFLKDNGLCVTMCITDPVKFEESILCEKHVWERKRQSEKT